MMISKPSLGNSRDIVLLVLNYFKKMKYIVTINYYIILFCILFYALSISDMYIYIYNEASKLIIKLYRKVKKTTDAYC